MKESEPPASPRWYFCLIVGLGLATLTYAGYRLLSSGGGYRWLILASLTIPAGAFALRLPGVKAKISISDTIICTNIILFGPAAGAITAALDALIGSLRCKTVSRRLEFMAFNVSCMTLSTALAGKSFFSIVSRGMISAGPRAPGGIFLLGLLILALVYFLANSFIVAVMVAQDEGENLFRVWSRRFLWAAISYIAASSVAGVIALTLGSVTSLSMLAVLAVVITVFISARSYVASLSESQSQQ